MWQRRAGQEPANHLSVGEARRRAQDRRIPGALRGALRSRPARRRGRLRRARAPVPGHGDDRPQTVARRAMRARGGASRALADTGSRGSGQTAPRRARGRHRARARRRGRDSRRARRRARPRKHLRGAAHHVPCRPRGPLRQVPPRVAAPATGSRVRHRPQTTRDPTRAPSPCTSRTRRRLPIRRAASSCRNLRLPSASSDASRTPRQDVARAQGGPTGRMTGTVKAWSATAP